MILSSALRKFATMAAILAAFALMAPVAFAGGHGRHAPHHGAYSHHQPVAHYPVRHDYRRPVYASPRQPRRVAYGYAGGYGDYGRYGYHRHSHWHVGDVIGALVAGAIITNVIADAVTPHTTVVERRVVSDPYYVDDAPRTRYVGSDGGYYQRR